MRAIIFMNPLYILIRQMDSNVPQLSKAAMRWRTAQASIQALTLDIFHSAGDNTMTEAMLQENKNAIMSIVTSRFDYAIKPIHKVAALLDPEFHPKNGNPAPKGWHGLVPGVFETFFGDDDSAANAAVVAFTEYCDSVGYKEECWGNARPDTTHQGLDLEHPHARQK